MSKATGLSSLASAGGFSLAEGVTAASGDGFLRWLVDYLVQLVGVDIALVGEFPEYDTSRLELKALSRRGTAAPASVYELSDSPLRGVLEDGSIAIEAGVGHAFAADALVASDAIEAAAGILLRDTRGAPLGILAVLHGENVADIESVISTLHLFVARLAGELELLRAARHVELTARASDGATKDKDEELASLLVGVSKALGVKVMFLSELVDSDQLISRTVALVIDGQLQENLEYGMLGTPCEYVLRSVDSLHQSGVRDLYPDDSFLDRVDAESYYSVGFFGVHGEPIGHLGVIHDRMLPETVRGSPLFKVLALRGRDAVGRRSAESRNALLRDRLLELQEQRLHESMIPGVVHDLKSLFTALLGNAALLLDRTPDPTTHRYAVRSQMICARANELVGHLLAVLGRGRATVSLVNMNDLVSETADLLRASIGAGVELTLDLDSSLSAIAGSRAELGQLVMNLVLNAAQSCSETGQVRINTASVRLDRSALMGTVIGRYLPEGEFVCVRVEDNGCGISADVLPRIFETRFSTRKDGHGLGLAVVREIARRHRAAVHISSEVNKGSVFSVFFSRG